MTFIANVLGSLKFFAARSDDDFTDRLHYILTTNLLLALSFLVSWKQFGGKPIECVVPDHVSGLGVEAYVENYCWAKNTYFEKFDDLITQRIEERKDKEIGYYQWVPFFFLLQAVCFQIPLLFWKMMAGHSGVRIHHLIEEASNPKNLDPKVRKSTIQTMATHLENAFRFQHRIMRRNISPHTIIRFFNMPYTAAYVTISYLIMKILYLGNVFVQFIMMNKFLETSDDQYKLSGLKALIEIINGTDWDHTGIFPRITLCDVRIRTMGNVQRFTTQCVLVINIFNEKIFIFLFFWFCALFVLTSASLVYWSIVLCFPCFGRYFVRRHMELSNVVFDPAASSDDVRRFVRKFLRIDGVFALRMLTMHAGVLFGTDLMASLWRTYFVEEGRIPWPVVQQPPTCIDQPDTSVQGPYQLGPPVYHTKWSEEDKKFDEQLDTLRRRKSSISRAMLGSTGLTEVLVVPANLSDKNGNSGHPYISCPGTPKNREGAEKEKLLS